MKRLLCGAIALLALAVAYHLGADSASSDYVDHSTTGIVAASDVGGEPLLLDENGIVWRVGSASWVQSSHNPLPVPIDQIKYWSETVVVTTDNTLWRYLHGWNNYGQWPGGAAATEQATWSGIKAHYSEPPK